MTAIVLYIFRFCLSDSVLINVQKVLCCPRIKDNLKVRHSKEKKVAEVLVVSRILLRKSIAACFILHYDCICNIHLLKVSARTQYLLTVLIFLVYVLGFVIFLDYSEIHHFLYA
jgi:uncharacterized protein YbaR (Trm112 family)